MCTQVTVLLADIRRANIPLWYADILVATIRLCAYYPNGASQTNSGASLSSEYTTTSCLLIRNCQPAQHPIIPPWDMNLTVPSGHELARYNGFVHIQPIGTSPMDGRFYIITCGKLVGVFERW